MQRQVTKRQVQVIQPTLHAGIHQSTLTPVVKKRVAAYARVSTEHEEQQSSYEAQVDYYTRKITERSDWVFVEVYTDKGISGTNTKKREGFNRMIRDALDGKIDLILTKSVSRFARNTVDTLTTIRKLKDRGVAVYFEEQSIDTLDGKGELLITIMSSIAQEESRSISDNVTWGQRKRFADGKVSLGYKQFLGFEKGEDGLPKVVEEEARIVRYIYRSFMMGKTGSHIARALTEAGIPTPGGKKQWQASTIMSILQNEKYKGAALLQKSFTVDFLEKRMKVNEGEVPQYYIEHSHEAIIDPLEHDRVQLEISRRKALDRHYSSAHLFSSKVICGECGGFFGRKVWHSTDAYKNYIWQCNEKYRQKQKCGTPHFQEEELDRHAVYAVTTGEFTAVGQEQTPPLMARDWKDPPVVGRPCEEYLVRRLTPDECCRLQGYPDGWCKDLESEDPNEDEILFWTEVFREWDAINGKPDKVRSRNAILKWLTAPNSDAAEYKAYGNSVAVPCVFFVLAGIVWALNKEVKS